MPHALATSLKSDSGNIDMLEKASTKSRKEGTQGAVAVLLKYNKVLIRCVSQDSDPKKSIPRKVGELRSNASAGHTVKFSGSTWYHIKIKIRERRGPL